MLPRLRRCSPRAAWLLAGLSLVACGSATPPATVELGAPPQASFSAAPSAEPAKDTPPPLDLSITFHPGFSGHLGWTRLPEPLSLQYLGNPGAAIQHFDTDWQQTKTDEIALKVFEIQLAQVDWPNTAVLLDEGHLCSSQLHDAIAQARPSRLLLRIDTGLTEAGVACLERLSTPRLYLAGCLHRSHRSEDRCDGDAEIRALAASEPLRPRIGGLALSLSTKEALGRLRRFPALTYLALVAGRARAPDAGFNALPFDGLPELRYLDISSWEPEQRVWGLPEELRFLGQLHVLRWQGEITAPIKPCQLRRLSSAHLRASELTAFAACTQLVELSSDSADLDSASALPAFTRLERLYLRHLRAEDLSGLATLGALRELSLPAGKGASFAFAARLPELRVIDLSQTSLSDLTPFARLEHLEQLDVGFTKVSDLAPLAHLDTLVELGLHQTGVVDVTPLSALHRLSKLNLSGTAVSDLGPLRAHPSLKWVILYDSKLHDVEALLTMPRLERAHIGGLTLPPPQLAALKQRLRYQLDGAR